VLLPLNLGVRPEAAAARWHRVSVSIVGGAVAGGKGFTVLVNVGGKGGVHRMRQGGGCDAGVVQVKKNACVTCDV
jgi:hypothetical protein